MNVWPPPAATTVGFPRVLYGLSFVEILSKMRIVGRRGAMIIPDVFPK